MIPPISFCGWKEEGDEDGRKRSGTKSSGEGNKSARRWMAWLFTQTINPSVGCAMPLWWRVTEGLPSREVEAGVKRRRVSIYLYISNKIDFLS